MKIDFKLYGKLNYTSDGEEDGRDVIGYYFWEVPEDILKHSIIAYNATNYNFENVSMFKQFVKDNDLYDILEENDEEELKDFIRDRYEYQAMVDYAKECGDND